MSTLGTLLILAGVVLIMFGLAFSGKLGPLGKLPGDIVIERGNFTLYFPIVTSIAIGIILSIIFWLLRK